QGGCADQYGHGDAHRVLHVVRHVRPSLHADGTWCGGCWFPSGGQGASRPRSAAGTLPSMSVYGMSYGTRCGCGHMAARSSRAPWGAGDLRTLAFMTVVRSVVLFLLAAVLEIGGAWLVWQ